jgi:hypothetical protein
LKHLQMLLVVMCLGACSGPQDSISEKPEILCSVERLDTPHVTPKKFAAGNPFRLAVTTSDSSFQSGRLVVTEPSQLLTGIESQKKFSASADSIVRSPIGSEAFYLVNRQGAERAGSIEVISRSALPTDDKRLGDYSVGKTTNPQDIVVIQDKVAYISRLNSKNLLKVNAIDGTQRCGIDLATGLADADGLPEIFRMKLIGSELWVILQRLNSKDRRYTPADKSLIAVIDTNTDVISSVITLTGTNANSDLKYGPDGNIYVAEEGVFGVWDGGIDVINPTTKKVLGFALTEAQVQADISDFEFTSNLGLALISASKKMSMIAFDPVAKKTVGVVPSVMNTTNYLSGIWKAPDGTFLLSDRNESKPSLRHFDANLNELSPITLGLAPYFVTVTD